MNNDPSNGNYAQSPEELSALMELGVGLLLSPRAETIGDEPTQRLLRLDAEDIPADSSLARSHIDGLQVRYGQVENAEGWPEGSEMMMVFIRYSSEALPGDRDKGYFMTYSPDERAPELVVTFPQDHEDDEQVALSPTDKEILELRSVLMAAHEIV